MIHTLKKYVKRKFSRELQILRRLDYIIYYLFYCMVCKTVSTQILMLSESREELSGNLKYIDDAIDKEKYSVIYSLRKSIIQKRDKEEKKKLCKMLATSKYILVDDFIPTMYPIPLRKGTRFIQVWHAMGAFKTVGFSRVGKSGGPSPRSLSHKNYTDTIVSSEAIRKNYAEAFGIGIEKVHAIGIPRTDIFFDADYQGKIRNELFTTYPQLKGKKVILFAPTFRGNGVRTAHYDYSWLSFSKLQERLGKEYVFIIKMHPFISSMPKEELDPSFYLNVSDEREINDFLFITDILITDYSSVIFEASLLDIKTIFFVPDYNEYIASRDFYYPYSEYTYGSVAYNEDELITAIQNSKNDEDKLKEFKIKFCSACDGHSTEKFVRFFFDEDKE